MAAAQLYGSLAASRMCCVPSSGLRSTPSTPRVLPAVSVGLGRGSVECLFVKSPALMARKLQNPFYKMRNVMRTPNYTEAYNDNTAILYALNQGHEQTNLQSTMEPIDEKPGIDKDAMLPQKNYAKIHDFCLGIPFGGILLSMGLIGFLFWRSPTSLILGFAPGLAILALCILSLNVWRGGKSCLPFTLAQAVVAALVMWKTFHTYILTKKILPWGFYGFLSYFIGRVLCTAICHWTQPENPNPTKPQSPPPPPLPIDVLLLAPEIPFPPSPPLDRPDLGPPHMDQKGHGTPSPVIGAPVAYPAAAATPYQAYHHIYQQQQQLQMFWADQYREIEATTDFKNHNLPLARIKKIMKADEDVRMIAAEAPVVFARACEMFILELTHRGWAHAEENKRRTLQKSDIAAAISRTEVFDFLVDIVPRDEGKDEPGLPCPLGAPGVPAAPDSLTYYYVPQ